MSYFRHGDPLDDFNRLDMKQAREEARLPVCDECRMRIHEDDYYDVYGEILCESCMKKLFRRKTEDLINQ
jgi:formylmethanofuran dehydrogenase subunit E